MPLPEISDKPGAGEETGASPEAKREADEVKTWLGQLDDARKREREFRREGDKVVAIFETAKKKQYQFNILFSNTETLAPALYNSTPRPVVQRRFKDEDPLGKMAATATQRSLEFLIDTGFQNYSPFDDLMKAAVLEGLVPGRGVTRFKYDAEYVEDQAEDGTAETGASEETDQEVQHGPEGENNEDLGKQEIASQFVCGEEVPWNRFLHGYGKKWSQVPWVSFEHMMTRDEAADNFGDVAYRIPLSVVSTKSDADSEMGGSSSSMAEGTKVELVHVYEIWDKVSRKVIFIAPTLPDKVLKKIDDPLGLSGFFPCPKPLTFMSKINDITPVALYRAYQEQAEELNTVTMRINRIVRALKVRGAYDSTVEGLERILEADDNVMVPVQNVAALDARGATLERALWMMPVDKLVTALQQLYLFRNQVKQTIYEITGIADIMRGSTAASETLGAQEIKNQWGTLRLKRAQKEVMRYVRDCMRIMAEIAMTKFTPETLRKMTGLPYPLQSEKQQAAQLLQAAQMQGVPPEQMQQDPQMAQAQQVAGQPAWEDVLQLLENDLSRAYRIDIETNSTIDAEATEDKQSIIELITAMSQFMTGIGPLVESGTMPFEVARGMLLTIVRRFRFGPELEDSLKEMKAPEPKPDPAVQKAQAQMQADQRKSELEAQAMQSEIQFKERMAQLEERMKQMEMQFKERELQLKQVELGMKQQAMERKNQADAQKHANDLQFMQQDHTLRMQGSVESHALKMQQARQAAQAKPAPGKGGGSQRQPSSA